MNIKSIFSVIATNSVNQARDFYVKYFGFEAVFDAGWYVQLHGRRNGSDIPLELAFMLPNNESLPPSLQHAFDGKGVFITIEVDEVDALYEQLRDAGYEAVVELRNETWGQRHFIIRDPSGSLLDVVKPIPPTEEYKAAYSQSEGPS